MKYKPLNTVYPLITPQMTNSAYEFTKYLPLISSRLCIVKC